MATIPVGADRAIAAPRGARRRYRLLRDAPLIPLVILGTLASVAVLAPVKPSGPALRAITSPKRSA